ncbi:helix-turn-helix domain-containing protein, partial [Enterococcus durans]
MFDILSNKLKRQLHLLELLFEKENYRFQDIEKKLACSAKTVRNDLNDIISYAKEIHIQMDRDIGVTVTIAPHITEDYIYRTILKESIEFRFLEAILLNHYGSYLELCEELFISESTLRRIVKKINQVLKKHQLTIRGLIKIIGKKETITQLMACLFQEKYTCLEEVF